MLVKYFARGLVLIFGGFLYLLGRGMQSPHEPDEVALIGAALQIVAVLFIFLVWFQWKQTAVAAPDWSKHRPTLAGVFILFGVLTIGALYALLHAAVFSEGRIAEAIKRIIEARFNSFGATLTIAFAAISVATGVGLYFDKAWARVSAKLLALPYALGWPVGLGAAVYTWWVLNPNSSLPLEKQGDEQALKVPPQLPDKALQHTTSLAEDKGHVPILGQSRSLLWIVLVPATLLVALIALVEMSIRQGRTPVTDLQRSHQYDDLFRKFWDSPDSPQPPRILRDQKSDKLPSAY